MAKSVPDKPTENRLTRLQARRLQLLAELEQIEQTIRTLGFPTGRTSAAKPRRHGVPRQR